MDWDDDRTQRQLDAFNAWNRAGRNGTITAYTGAGKTMIGLFAMKHMDNQFVKNMGKHCNMVLVAPSEPVLSQWRKLFIKCGLQHVFLYTKEKASKAYNSINCDLLVVDEIHSIPTKSCSRVLLINSLMRLGLTATFERLDGRHVLLEKYGFKVVENISKEEGTARGWTAKCSIYRVLCEVDCTQYNNLTTRFKEVFSYFGYSMEAPMAILDKKHRMHDEILKNYVEKRTREVEKEMVGIHGELSELIRERIRKACFGEIVNKARQFISLMTQRKSFINHHPKKIEMTKLIISRKMDKKGITFFNSIEDARKVGVGVCYTYKGTKKSKSRIIENFKKSKTGVINTVKALNMGFDCPDINYAVIAGFDSSKTNRIQRIGRVIRVDKLTKGKEAEVFFIVLKGTRDNEWFKASIGDNEYHTILEEDLESFLDGKKIEFAPNR